MYIMTLSTRRPRPTMFKPEPNYLTLYLEELENSGCSPKTLKCYQSFLKNIDDKKAAEIPVAMKEAYKGYASSSLATKNTVYATLNAFGNWMLKKKYLSANPMEDIRQPKAPDRNPRAILSQDMEEINKRISQLGLKYKVAFSLLRDMALRASELVDLNVESFELDADDPYVRIKGKGGKVRILPISQKTELYSDLVTYIGALGYKRGPLIMSDRKCRESYRTILRKFQEVAPGFTPHMFRHTQASKLVQKTKNTKLAQEFLGHASLATTQRYLHMTDAQYKSDIREFLEG